MLDSSGLKRKQDSRHWGAYYLSQVSEVCQPVEYFPPPNIFMDFTAAYMGLHTTIKRD